MMNHFPSKTTAWLAVVVGIATILGVIFLSLFFAVGQLWGSLNDAFIALEAILSAALAWTLYSTLRSGSPALSLFGLIAAGVGALVVIIGSWLVISGKTDYVLAEHYMSLGFGLIGLWLLILNDQFGKSRLLPTQLIRFGLIVGVFMLVGLLSGYGVVHGLGGNDITPWFVQAGDIAGVVGWMILYPIWCIWLGRALLSSSAR
ncbi:MAG: hypothetical protein Q8L87_13555 [Anaerolineales bacterium]|jgi:hypothetical protein|nr:hypothetical protein [Anaerolineales bacterium]